MAGIAQHQAVEGCGWYMEVVQRYEFADLCRIKGFHALNGFYIHYREGFYKRLFNIFDSDA
jgi:hypothetical protein